MDNLTELAKYIQSRLCFDDFHGMAHWEEVERNGILLEKFNPEINF